MSKLSVVIICKNEERNISRCLESVKWADEIVIYDSGSHDSTLTICEQFNCNIFHNHNWEGFGQAKNEAVNLAKFDWILSIDADEEVSEKLKFKIQDILKNPNPTPAYKIKRISYYMGKQINYSGWQRDFPLRLFNRKYGNFNLKLVHESVQINSKPVYIKEEILHYTYPFIKTHIDKMIRYSELGAEQSFEKNKTAGICKALSSGIAKFFKMYILNFGFLDGKTGLILAVNSAFGVYLKYIYLWEKNKQL